MTAMNAMVTETEIVLSMDTLVSKRLPEGNIEPSYFTQKFEILPFAKSIIAGTGSFGVIELAISLARKMLVRDVTTLARILSDYLRDRDNSDLLPGKSTATVYIFGFDKGGKTRAYALRSTADFSVNEVASTDNPNALLKPQPDDKQHLQELTNYVRDSDARIDERFVQIMRKQKEWDDALEDTNENKVGIGGENTLVIIADDFQQVALFKIDIFPDYEEQYKFCLKHVDVKY